MSSVRFTHDYAIPAPRSCIPPRRPPPFAPRAKPVIQLFMPGGPSQVDTFDYKPLLAKHAGERPVAVNRKTLRNTKNGLMPSPFAFKQYGQSGIPVSSLFPHVAECVDDLAIVRSMTSNFSEHTNANYFLHTGSGLQGRPSMGAWAGYGLGSENADLPGFTTREQRIMATLIVAQKGNLRKIGGALDEPEFISVLPAI